MEIVRRKESEIRHMGSRKRKCVVQTSLFVDLKVKLQKRRNLERKSVEDAEAASGSTMEEPWPKPVGDSQESPKVLAREALQYPL